MPFIDHNEVPIFMNILSEQGVKRLESMGLGAAPSLMQKVMRSVRFNTRMGRDIEFEINDALPFIKQSIDYFSPILNDRLDVLLERGELSEEELGVEAIVRNSFPAIAYTFALSLLLREGVLSSFEVSQLRKLYSSENTQTLSELIDSVRGFKVVK